MAVSFVLSPGVKVSPPAGGAQCDAQTVYTPGVKVSPPAGGAQCVAQRLAAFGSSTLTVGLAAFGSSTLTVVEAAMELESSTLECYLFARNSWVVVPIYQEH